MDAAAPLLRHVPEGGVSYRAVAVRPFVPEGVAVEVVGGRAVRLRGGQRQEPRGQLGAHDRRLGAEGVAQRPFDFGAHGSELPVEPSPDRVLHFF